MSCCLQIRTKTFNAVSIKYIEADDYIYLDINQEDPRNLLNITRQLNELNDVNKINLDIYYTLELLKTEKNITVLENIYHPNTFNRATQPIDIEVLIENVVYTDVVLYIKDVKEFIQVDINFHYYHWANRFKQLKINEISIPDWSYTIQGVQTSAVEKWLDGTFGFVYPLIDYGRLISIYGAYGDGYLPTFYTPLQFYRPFVFITYILKQAFCDIGWFLQSPILFSNFGRKLIAYLIKQDYGIVESITDLDVNLTLNESFAMPIFNYPSGKRTFNSPFLFIGATGNLNYVKKVWNLNAYYEGVGVVDIEGEIRINAWKDGRTVYIALVREPKKYGTPYHYNNSQFPRYPKEFALVSEEFYIEKAHDAESYVSLSISLKNVTITDGEYLFVYVHSCAKGTASYGFCNESKEPGVDFFPGSFLNIKGVRKLPLQNEVVKWSDMASDDIVLNLLKGVIHQLNLKILTNRELKTVKLLQPYEINLFEEELEGFFTEEIEQLDFICDSEQVIVPAKDSKRYLNVSFKNSTDPYIEKLGLKTELFSYKDDLGSEYLDTDVEEYKNPFFEPTADNVKPREAENAINRQIRIPTIGENKITDKLNDLTWDIAPRILVWFGNVGQSLNSNPYKNPQVNYDILAQTSPLINFASQFAPIEITAHNSTDFGTVSKALYYNIFGLESTYNNNFENTNFLYKLLYRRFIHETKYNIEVNILRFFTIDEFDAITFRKKYLIYYKGEPVLTRLNKLVDFNSCYEIPISVELKAVNVEEGICEYADEVYEGTCNSRLRIEYTRDYDTNCYTFQVSGYADDVITDIEFYIQTNGVDWVLLTNETPVSVIVCDLSIPFSIKAAIDFLHCTDIELSPVYVDPCADENIHGDMGLMIEKFIVNDSICFKAFIIGNTSVSYVTLAFNYEVDGDAETGTPYVEGTLLCDYPEGSVIQFYALIQYYDCEPIELRDLLEISDDPQLVVKCDSIVNELDIIVNETTGCVTFNRVGLIPAGIPTKDIIMYQIYDININPIDGWGDWILWDGVPLCEVQNLRVQRFIEYCNDACPMSCSEIYYLIPE